jgi:hypothetical protein
VPARAAAAVARVLYGTADEVEGGVPLAGAVLLARAAIGLHRGGPARLGVLALEGGLAEPSGAGSRSGEVVYALWWLIVELADECPLVLLLDDAQWAEAAEQRRRAQLVLRHPGLHGELHVGFPEGGPVGDRIGTTSSAPGCRMSIISAGLSLPHAANAWASSSTSDG